MYSIIPKKLLCLFVLKKNVRLCHVRVCVCRQCAVLTILCFNLLLLKYVLYARSLKIIIPKKHVKLLFRYYKQSDF
jgi:hypothetical protein